MKVLIDHTNCVTSLAISKEGQLINGSCDKSINVWDIKKGKILKTLNGHTGSVRSLAISQIAN